LTNQEALRVFLADRTNGRAIGTVLCPSSSSTRRVYGMYYG